MAQEWLGTLLHRALRDRHIDEVRRFALAGADLEVHNEMGQLLSVLLLPPEWIRR
jgi:hypothetical protein